VYSRELDGETKTFGISGKLWNGVLVLFDRESGSHWTQLDGRAIQGEELGRRLEHVPSVFTTFGAWVEAHPDTLVLEKTEDEKERRESLYAPYLADPEALRLPHIAEALAESGLPVKTVVFGVRLAGDALAVPESVLERDTVVNTSVGGRAVALLRDSLTGGVIGRIREVEGATLELLPVRGHRATERVRTADGGRTFLVDELEALRVDRAYWYAWVRTVGTSRVLGE